MLKKSVSARNRRNTIWLQQAMHLAKKNFIVIEIADDAERCDRVEGGTR